MLIQKTRTVNKTQPCLGATLTVIQSLGVGFVRKTVFDYRIISPLSFMPTQVSPASLTSLVDQLPRAKVSLLAKSLNVTLQCAIKHVLTSPTLRHPVEPGVQHIIMTAACMVHSEAICETLGSIVEKYHALRHTNTGQVMRTRHQFIVRCLLDSTDHRLQQSLSKRLFRNWCQGRFMTTVETSPVVRSTLPQTPTSVASGLTTSPATQLTDWLRLTLSRVGRGYWSTSRIVF